ncbi:MAG: DUF3108 domain-containing protein [candidate division Zixibacteria bacterium]|nr:DUF3108 domain-containing protein [candidate division Zixibacteria bacterium]
MKLRTLIHKINVTLFLIVGIVPIVYFARIQYGSAESLPATDSTSDSTGELQSETDSLGSLLDRKVTNLAFGVGERLEFSINYGFINAGSAMMETLEMVEWEGRPCYHIRTLAKSNSFFSSFFPVNDTVLTIMDAVGLYSWHFEKKLKEGSYSSDRIYTFDHINKRAFYQNDTIPIPSFIQDALSSLYYVRTLDLKVGESVFVDNFSSGKVSKLEIKALRRETIETQAGEFDCIVVEPLMQAAGVFKHDGRLTVWLTNDKLKMPVMMKSKALVGSISAELVNYELGEIEEFY